MELEKILGNKGSYLRPDQVKIPEGAEIPRTPAARFLDRIAEIYNNIKTCYTSTTQAVQPRKL